MLADVLAGKLRLESIFEAVIAKFLRRAQNRRKSRLVSPVSTSAYVKVLPKTILAAGHRVIVLVYVLADVLVGNLPLESVSKAVVAKFLRRAQNRRKSMKVGNRRSSGCGSFVCEQTQQLILWFGSVSWMCRIEKIQSIVKTDCKHSICGGCSYHLCLVEAEI